MGLGRHRKHGRRLGAGYDTSMRDRVESVAGSPGEHELKSFVHLHNHTEYSMLDGAARIGDALDKAVRDSQPAMAITDHGNMYGVLDFYKEANRRGVNPIIGIEAYMAGGSRFDRPARRGRVDDSLDGESGAEKLYYHIILLA